MILLRNGSETDFPLRNAYGMVTEWLRNGYGNPSGREGVRGSEEGARWARGVARGGVRRTRGGARGAREGREEGSRRARGGREGAQGGREEGLWPSGEERRNCEFWTKRALALEE